MTSYRREQLPAVFVPNLFLHDLRDLTAEGLLSGISAVGFMGYGIGPSA